MEIPFTDTILLEIRIQRRIEDLWVVSITFSDDKYNKLLEDYLRALVKSTDIDKLQYDPVLIAIDKVAPTLKQSTCGFGVRFTKPLPFIQYAEATTKEVEKDFKEIDPLIKRLKSVIDLISK